MQINKAQDTQGFRSLLKDSLGDYVAMMFMPGFSTILEDSKRLRAVDLAVRGRRGERYGQDGPQRSGTGVWSTGAMSFWCGVRR